MVQREIRRIGDHQENTNLFCKATFYYCKTKATEYVLSVYCWNGHQLLVRLLRFLHLLHPLCLLRFSRHLPLAFQQDPFGFFQKEKGFKPKSFWEKLKGAGWKAKRREKEKKEERGKENTRCWGAIQQRFNIVSNYNLIEESEEKENQITLNHNNLNFKTRVKKE